MARILISGKEVEAEPGRTISDIISENGYHPDSYLYMISGKPVPMDTVLSETDEVKAIRVASGG